jgi:hypothetical protein
MAADRAPLAGRCLQSGSNPARELGSAFVEFSLVVLFLQVLLWGTFDLTALLLDYNALNKKVRDAASFWSTHALDPETAMPVELAAPLDGQGLALQDLLANLVRCGAYQCQGSSNPPVVVQTGKEQCPDDGKPLSAGDEPYDGAILKLCYCHDHDALSYVTVRADLPHEFSLLSAVLGAAVVLRASALVRIPSVVVYGGTVPLCTPRP